MEDVLHQPGSIHYCSPLGIARTQKIAAAFLQCCRVEGYNDYPIHHTSGKTKQPKEGTTSTCFQVYLDPQIRSNYCLKPINMVITDMFFIILGSPGKPYPNTSTLQRDSKFCASEGLELLQRLVVHGTGQSPYLIQGQLATRNTSPEP